MADLTVKFAGLTLPSPIFVGSGPNTRTAEPSITALKAGAGIVEYGFLGGRAETESLRGIDQIQVLPHAKALRDDAYFGYASTGYSRVWASPHQGVERKMADMRRIKAETKGLGALCSSIGLVNYRNKNEPGYFTWGEMARMSEEAGADAITLHLQTGQELAGKLLTEDPQYLRDTIREVKNACDLPVIAKTPIEGCDPVHIVKLALEAGADGVAPTGRYVGLHIDIGEETVPEWNGFHGFGGPWALPITSAWMARMRRAGVRGFVVPGGGVMAWQDVVRLLLVGGTMVQACSWPVLKGYDSVRNGIERIGAWMDAKGYATLDEVIGRSADRLVEPQSVWGRVYEKGPFEDVIDVDRERCVGCGACEHPCYFDAIKVGQDCKAHIDRAACAGCGHCYHVCPHGAIRLTGSLNRPVSKRGDAGGRGHDWMRESVRTSFAAGVAG